MKRKNQMLKTRSKLSRKRNKLIDFSLKRKRGDRRKLRFDF
uniref:Uncharacterized protein n=1 Tax=Ciona savignyi TaxID=51511 RepID=H2Z6J8_CIOSA